MILRPPISSLFPYTTLFRSLELRVRLAEVVEEPARRRDDHVDRAAERVLLRTHADAAEDRRAGEGCVDAELGRSEEHTSELQSQSNLVCSLLLEKKKSHTTN